MAARKNRGGRPTNSELAQKRIDSQKHAAYEAQEAKRGTKLQIDQNIVLYGWLMGVAVGFVSSAIVSFNGITAVSSYVGLEFAWMRLLFFFFIELFYLLFLLAYLVLESRSEGSRGALVGMIFFAGVSVFSNLVHTLLFHKFDLADITTWIGVVLSVAAPIAIISSSKLASSVVFAKAIKLDN